MKLTTLIAPVALTLSLGACAVAVPVPTARMEPVVMDEANMKTADHPVCERLASDYQTAMVALQPKKKKRSLLSRMASPVAGAAAGVAGMNGNLKAMQGLGAASDVADAVQRQDDIEDSVNFLAGATSMVELNRMTMANAQTNGCPLDPIFGEGSDKEMKKAMKKMKDS